MTKRVIFSVTIMAALLISSPLAAITPTPIAKIPYSEFRPYILETLAPIVEPDIRIFPTGRPSITVVEVEPKVIDLTTPEPKITGNFIYDPEISWYGPGFYGNRTACGLAYTKTILGVAHRSLPCGTQITFKHGTKVITVPVIDRGPYVDDRQWDLSGGLCVKLNHCFTGPIYYRIEG